eukprot:3940482-Rhodomonas_salina.3
MLRTMFAANTASLMTVRDSVGYVSRSDSVEAVDPQEITGVAAIDAASASGPVTADRYEPMMAC